MTKKELLDYLTNCKDLEMTIYQSGKEYEQLRRESEKYGIAYSIEMPDKDQIRSEVENEKGLLSIIALILGGLIFILPTIIMMFIAKAIVFGSSPWSTFQFIVCAVIAVGLTVVGGWVVGAGLFLLITKIMDIVEYIVHTPEVKSRYETALQNYHAAIQSDQMRVANERAQKAIILSRMNELREKMNETEVLLRRLYDVGLIYPKYRGLVPIVMFCEYIESGRCEGLEGHEGAYNIYENELRQNIIIAKLDVVINKLDQIKQNQYMLANAIEQSKRQVKSLCQATLASAGRLESIENNTAITAENARIAAQNTYALGQLEIYKLWANK